MSRRLRLVAFVTGAIGLVIAAMVLIGPFFDSSGPSTLTDNAEKSEAFVQSVVAGLNDTERKALQNHLDQIAKAAETDLSAALDQKDMPKLAELAQSAFNAMESLGEAWKKAVQPAETPSAPAPIASGPVASVPVDPDGLQVTSAKTPTGGIGAVPFELHSTTFSGVSAEALARTAPVARPTDKAIIAHSYLVAKASYDKAVSASPLVAEVIKRLKDRPLDQRAPQFARTEAQNIVASEPCFGRTGKIVAASFVAVRTVSIGMTLDQALTNLCAAQKGIVRLATPAINGLSFGGFMPSPFRSSEGHFWREFYTQKRADAQFDQDVNNFRSDRSKPYVSQMTLCLKCATPEGGFNYDRDGLFDTIELLMLPDNRVAGIVRSQEFSDFIQIPTANGQGRQEKRVVPQTLKNLDAAFRKQFGEPSFLGSSIPRSNTIEIAIGWVLPDGKSSFPTETWYSGLGNHIQLNRDGAIYDSKGGISRAKLASLNPRASYCLTNAFEFPVSYSSVMALNFMPESRELTGLLASVTGVKVPKESKTVPGATESCGIVILAKLVVANVAAPTEAQENSALGSEGLYDSVAGDIRELMKRNVPIASYSLQVRNINIIRDYYRTQEKTVTDAVLKAQNNISTTQQARGTNTYVP